MTPPPRPFPSSCLSSSRLPGRFFYFKWRREKFRMGEKVEAKRRLLRETGPAGGPGGVHVSKGADGMTAKTKRDNPGTAAESCVHVSTTAVLIGSWLEPGATLNPAARSSGHGTVPAGTRTQRWWDPAELTRGDTSTFTRTHRSPTRTSGDAGGGGCCCSNSPTKGSTAQEG